MKTSHRICRAASLCLLFTSLSAADPALPENSPAVPKGLSASDWNGIRAAHERHRHSAVARDGGHQAHNPGQQWKTTFDGRGFLVTPNGANWTWGLELRSYGFGGSERPAPSIDLPKVTTKDTRVTYQWDDRLQEWFINDKRGVEHGFTLDSRPPSPIGGAVSDLQFELAVRGTLKPEVKNGGSDVHFFDAQGALVLNYSGLKVTDADGKTLRSHFESVGDGLLLRIDESSARYPLTIDPLAQQAYLKASNPADDANFGVSVAISGDTVVVGATGDASNATGVDGDESDTSAPDSGAAYVFERNNGVWTLQAYLKASNTEAGDEFGCSVSIDGDVIVVGARKESSDATGIDGDQDNNDAAQSGAAYVFVRFFYSWEQEAYIKASDTAPDDFFGDAVSISGDVVVVGAYRKEYDSMDDTSVGAAYVFLWDGSWSEQTKIDAPSVVPNTIEFGRSVAISGDRIVIGAPREEPLLGFPDAGAAYVFQLQSGSWTEEAHLVAPDAEADNLFGTAVAISGQTIVIGAPGESSGATGVNGDMVNNSAPSSGAAYVYHFVLNWDFQAYLKASNTETNDAFGSSVALAGDTAVVGAPGEASIATGIDGNQNDNSASDTGAAYVFARSAGIWSQTAYLKASNTDGGDGFAGGPGVSVAVFGDTIVVGAPNEDGSDNGVNGDQTDNDSPEAGAAYIFQRTPTWHNAVISANANVFPANNCGVAHDKWLLYYYKTFDYTIGCAFWTGSAWAQAQLGALDNVTGDMLAFTPDYSAIYYEGCNQLWAVYYDGFVWQQIQLTTTANVANDVVADTSWNIIHYRGTDDRIWAAYWNGSEWVQESLGGDANVSGELAVDPNWHTVFYRGFDGHLWVYYYDGTAWVQAQLSTIANLDCSVATDGPGLIYYKDDDETRWACYWDGSAWVQVQLFPNVSVGEETRMFSHLLPVYLGNDGRLRYHHFNGLQWVDGIVGSGGWGLRGGLAVSAPHGLLYPLIFAARDDLNIVVFYYQ